MSKRSRAKYPGTDKSVTLKIRHELLDADYLHTLDHKDKKWYSDFMREYASADLDHPGKKLHRTKKLRKSIYDANNARNRDAFAVTKSNGMLKGIDKQKAGSDNVREFGMSGSKSTVLDEVENTIIAVLDDFTSKNIQKSEEPQKTPRRKKLKRR